MPGLSRRRFLKRMGVGTCLAAGARDVWAQDDARRPPNIVFIMVDDMGYGDLGCYGSKAIHTPRIDRMAAEGMKFTQVYSGCAVCAPARSALMTGLHLGHTPVRGNTGGVAIPAGTVTLAQGLKNAGYVTGGFGKWGLGDIGTTGVPEKHGFDTFFGYYHQIHAHYYFPEYLIHNGRKVPLPNNRDGEHGDYSHTLIFEEMLSFIRENRDRPFFCYAPWTPPHGQYDIPKDESAVRRYKNRRDWPRKARTVAAMDTMIDRHVGQVLDLLAELDLDKQTIVFFCSDNGAADRFDGVLDSSGPLRGAKRTLHEGGIRVPMVVRWPGRIAAGAVSDLPWYFPDVMPTLADLAHAPQSMPQNIDGISVAPTLLGEGGQARHECLYWEWPLYDWSNHRYNPEQLAQAVRRGDWKMLRHRTDAPWELYDLSKDPGEQTDRSADHSDVVEQLAAWIEVNRVAPDPQIEPEMPEGKHYR